MAELNKPMYMRNLLAIGDNPEKVSWEPFREGVQIHRLYGGEAGQPAAALLRYAPGAQVPCHRHGGYEHILVLSGSQSDQHGCYEAGTLMISPPGTEHAVSSADGCVVLAVWQAPVEFL